MARAGAGSAVRGARAAQEQGAVGWVGVMAASAAMAATAAAAVKDTVKGRQRPAGEAWEQRHKGRWWRGS